MTPDVLGAIIAAVLWFISGFAGAWLIVAFTAAMLGAKVAASAEGDYESFVKMSKRSMLIFLSAWIPAIAWLVFAIIQSVVQAVSIFV